MAKDAKIGSLIGLVLIFIIAFVINGFTGSRGAPDTSEASTDPADNWSDFDAGETGVTDGSTEEVREPDPLTENTANAKSAVSHPATGSTAQEPITEDNPDALESEAQNRPLPEILYTVCEGDNLADIAKKFYGPEEGNKRANILRIFLANQKILTSPNEIFVGQKLVIPPLKALASDLSIFQDSMFETVKSVGRRHLSNLKPDRLYAVQEGDSLWSIASTLLGDGSRYKEISKLNAIILKDENQLAVGMRLRIPAQ